MEQILEQLNWISLVLAAITTTFIVSAITGLFEQYFEKKRHKKWLVFFVAILITVLSNVWVEGMQWQSYLLEFLLTWAFAILFYSYLGLWIVKRIFEKIKQKLK